MQQGAFLCLCLLRLLPGKGASTLLNTSSASVAKGGQSKYT